MVIVDRQALWSTGRSLASGDKLLTCSCLLEVEWLTLIWGIFSSGCPLLLKAIDKIVYCDNLMLVLFSIEFQERRATSRLDGTRFQPKCQSTRPREMKFYEAHVFSLGAPCVESQKYPTLKKSIDLKQESPFVTE
ncbi:hypothetical protein RRG08_046345 [Elysia crispata]|uniref:Uncharacterized protein n=1 Tax=Elysia crispata TaxID=231223 RepID=A0AAE1A5H9_9GAST|nr:hypothetical protein RRG08_046345 [Elysia crispata]